jgi:hypothetical protein
MSFIIRCENEINSVFSPRVRADVVCSSNQHNADERQLAFRSINGDPIAVGVGETTFALRRLHGGQTWVEQVRSVRIDDGNGGDGNVAVEDDVGAALAEEVRSAEDETEDPRSHLLAIRPGDMRDVPVDGGRRGSRARRLPPVGHSSGSR